MGLSLIQIGAEVCAAIFLWRFARLILCLTKSRSTFEINKMQRGCVTCYMGPAGAIMGQARFSVGTDSATRERTPPGPSNRAKVAIKWMNRTTRLRIAES